MTGRLLALLACVWVLSGCANIQDDTVPQIIPNSEAPTQKPPQGPAKDAEAITVVRDFIRNSGNTTAAQAYLTEEAKRAWHPDNQPTIIEDDFSTVPQSPDKEGDPNQITVEVKGTRMGILNQDKSFTAQQGALSQAVRLAKQDGQWRIAQVPANGLIVPLIEFNLNYRPVRLYFYDVTKSVVVPDLRYLPAAPSVTPSDVVQLLLLGPASSLDGAMRSALPRTATQRTNAALAKDNVLVVNLGDIGNPNREDKELIAQQVMLSLRDLASTVRIQAEGVPLVPERSEWRAADVQTLSDKTTPGAQYPGYVVVNNRMKSLKDLTPVPGPAGSGEYHVESVAQSGDGSDLALVERTNAGLQLRVGNTNVGLRVVYGPTTEMTRPTWQPGLSANQTGSNEVWTVADGAVVRLARTKDNNWYGLPVDYTSLSKFGKITDLRLSRDGVRVAVVADGKLYVGAVARTDNSTGVTIAAPKLVPRVTSAVSVDWLNPSTVMVATNSPTGPVWRVPVDGVEPERYSLSNLTQPLTSITAAPSRTVVVTDAVGMWGASEVGQIWQPFEGGQGPTAHAFYPG
ncbi:LpqB family beta-propeller domain-containing protein [Actinocrispum wychmicini]|uniref:Lipoprotein LpqB-like beta-propeller protein n=1 Tax=Actinocrispum wychmicini TaxID=1213861 RepID=A0A4R2K1W1_9PSEU|nr:LpqB family beta-propeller domain-containing protein [Actinocrispum wychmicini]TCO65697.1 lipoprotein LpqB-like beta-propeller protein [Actinocrispum wychmicini]